MQQPSLKDRVLCFPHFLVHFVLRAHSLLHLLAFLRILTSQKIRPGQEKYSLAIATRKPRPRDGQWNVRKLTYKHPGTHLAASKHCQNITRVWYLQYALARCQSLEFHQDARGHLPRFLLRPRYRQMLYLLRQLQRRWSTEAVPLLQASVPHQVPRAVDEFWGQVSRVQPHLPRPWTHARVLESHHVGSQPWQRWPRWKFDGVCWAFNVTYQWKEHYNFCESAIVYGSHDGSG